ncbi:MAG: hypothetical protein ABJ249_09550, partial [Lentilitoribacter sp.]
TRCTYEGTKSKNSDDQQIPIRGETTQDDLWWGRPHQQNHDNSQQTRDKVRQQLKSHMTKGIEKIAKNTTELEAIPLLRNRKKTLNGTIKQRHQPSVSTT